MTFSIIHRDPQKTKARKSLAFNIAGIASTLILFIWLMLSSAIFLFLPNISPAAILYYVGASVLLIFFVGGIFYLILSLGLARPLNNLAVDIANVDPAWPAAGMIRTARGHEDSELGLISRSLNRLFIAFQKGLQERDQATNELAELAMTLEERVEERTNELKQALNRLEKEKDGVEMALMQLNEAHDELNRYDKSVMESIQYASRIQISLLPELDKFKEHVYDISVLWLPRDIVGGDFYTLGRFLDRYTVIGIFDCTGHGVPGAFMTAILSSSLDRVLHEYCHDNPATILQMLNRFVKAALRQDGEGAISDDGVDAAVCVIDSKNNVLHYAGAGIPLIYGKDGQIEEIKADRHSLGYKSSNPDFEFKNHEIPLTAGMSFYLATDGVFDQVGETNRRLFGRKRFKEILANNLNQSIHGQIYNIIEALDEYRGNEARRDDMTLIGFVV